MFVDYRVSQCWLWTDFVKVAGVAFKIYHLNSEETCKSFSTSVHQMSALANILSAVCTGTRSICRPIDTLVSALSSNTLVTLHYI